MITPILVANTTKELIVLILILNINFMKNLFFLLLILISNGYSSQNNMKEINSKITDVTVFLSGAQITRSATIDLKTGEQVLKLSGLSPYIDPNSIQIKGNSKYTIVSVKHEINYIVDNSVPEEIRIKKDSLETLEFNLKMRRSLRVVFQNEKKLLNANQNIKGDNSNLLVEDLEEMADFFRKRLKEIEFKLLDLDVEESRLSMDIVRLKNQINQSAASSSFNTGEILVALKTDAKKTGNLQFSYQLGNAGWYPVYDLRAEDINQPLELIYRGKVFQSTGNNWDKVSLTLSTGNPSIGGQAPELSPWNLYLQEMYRQKSMGYYKKERSSSQIIKLEEATIDAVMIYDDEDKKNDFNQLVDMQTNTINAEFKITIPYSIPKDGQAYDVEMQRSDLQANYSHFTIPKLEQEVFLIANITDWRQYNLLPGESNIYFQGTFVGKAFIDPANTEDTLNLSVGRDPSIIVTRDRIQDYCKTSSMGSKKKTTKGYKIVVKNTESEVINILIEDQLPISTNNEIDVTMDDTSGGKLDAETGKITWKLELNPGESKTLILKYTVKYPKKKIIPNL